MSYINQEFSLLTTETAVITIDRWENPRYSVQLDSGTSILVEGTLVQVNRKGNTAVWATINEIDGSPMTTITAGITGIQATPYEAIRITATGTCVGRVMQTGSE